MEVEATSWQDVVTDQRYVEEVTSLQYSSHLHYNINDPEDYDKRYNSFILVIQSTLSLASRKTNYDITSQDAVTTFQYSQCEVLKRK